jgi:hypothetical protein
MSSKIIDFFKKTPISAILSIVGIILIIISSLFLLWQGNKNSTQSMPALLADVYFEGEYKIGDGDGVEIKEGVHISSTQGVVTLRGKFHKLNPIGEYEGVYQDTIAIAFYLNHIKLTFCVDVKNVINTNKGVFIPVSELKGKEITVLVFD